MSGSHFNRRFVARAEENPHRASPIKYCRGLVQSSQTTEIPIGEDGPIFPEGTSSSSNFSRDFNVWDIGIFYHVACIGDWTDVVSEQLDSVRRAGLDGLHVSLLGSAGDRAIFEAIAKAMEIAVVIDYHSTNIEEFEFPAIILLQRWAHAHPGQYLIYFHTKGVSTPGNMLKLKWRRLMAFYVIGKWRENVIHLQSGHDACGVNWQMLPGMCHFSGNFFATTSEYIFSLADFPVYLEQFPGNFPNVCRRFAAEFWFGSGKVAPRILSYVTENQTFEDQNFWKRLGNPALPSKPIFLETPRGNLTVYPDYVGHGEIGTNFDLGYENQIVQLTENYDLAISAHAISRVVISTESPILVTGCLNLTSRSCSGAEFWVNNRHLGSCLGALDSTRIVQLLPGRHELCARGRPDIGYCHTVWGINFGVDALSPQIESLIATRVCEL